MVKLLILAAIVVVAFLLVRRLLTKGSAPDKTPAQSPSEPTEAKLVRCVECGAFVPKAEAVVATNGFRCGAGCAPR